MDAAQQRWDAVDHWIESNLVSQDTALAGALAASAEAGLPAIQVSPAQGQLLELLVRMADARSVLEIGTLGGYSTIWLARALPPGGRLISLELDPHHAEVARRSIARAGLADKVEVRVGPALESLSHMEASGEALFDLAFIDADKDGYVAYLEKALALVRDGGLILGDNTLPEAVLDPAGDSGTKRYNTAVAANPELVSALFPVLRDRGLDGLLISVKRENR